MHGCTGAKAQRAGHHGMAWHGTAGAAKPPLAFLSLEPWYSIGRPEGASGSYDAIVLARIRGSTHASKAACMARPQNCYTKLLVLEAQHGRTRPNEKLGACARHPPEPQGRMHAEAAAAPAQRSSAGHGIAWHGRGSTDPLATIAWLQGCWKKYRTLPGFSCGDVKTIPGAHH